MAKITGAHTILYSSDPDGDRAFVRDVLGFGHVDLGEGWLIFRLPPSELAVHPTHGPVAAGSHELYLMCDDVEGLRAELIGKGVPCSEIQAMPWGRLTAVTLPGGSELGVYQPLHETPPES